MGPGLCIMKFPDRMRLAVVPRWARHSILIAQSLGEDFKSLVPPPPPPGRLLTTSIISMLCYSIPGRINSNPSFQDKPELGTEGTCRLFWSKSRSENEHRQPKSTRNGPGSDLSRRWMKIVFTGSYISSPKTTKKIDPFFWTKKLWRREATILIPEIPQLSAHYFLIWL